MPIRTEVFDDFTNESAQDHVLTKKSEAEIEKTPTGPPLQFLNELKQKLRERATKLEQIDEVAFKAFDDKTQKFVVITKEERDKQLK